MIAKTNFTLGPIKKSLCLSCYNGLLFSLIDHLKEPVGGMFMPTGRTVDDM